MNFGNVSQTLVLFGIVLIILGLVFQFGLKIPILGKLPGDIFIDRGNFKFFFPLTTSILISMLLTLIINLFRR